MSQDHNKPFPLNSNLFILILAISLILSACKTNFIKNNLKTGDLIFVETNDKDLSGAISRVTKQEDSPISYDHIGIIERNGRDIYILHANKQNGSTKENIASFIKSHKNTRMVVYRLKEAYTSSIPSAIEKAHDMLGKPYNTLYIRNDSSYYCSDYVQRAFEDDDIFKLNPMTFVNPTTGETDEYWEKFYAEFNQPIPEGELGCNPNGLSKSDKIYRVAIISE